MPIDSKFRELDKFLEQLNNLKRHEFHALNEIMIRISDLRKLRDKPSQLWTDRHTQQLRSIEDRMVATICGSSNAMGELEDDCLKLLQSEINNRKRLNEQWHREQQEKAGREKEQRQKELLEQAELEKRLPSGFDVLERDPHATMDLSQFHRIRALIDKLLTERGFEAEPGCPSGQQRVGSIEASGPRHLRSRLYRDGNDL